MKQAALACLITLLAACMTTPNATQPSVAVRLAKGQSPWTATGKVIVKAVDTASAESVRFQWRRRNLASEVITLSGPLGVGTVRLVREDDTVFWYDGARARTLDSAELAPAVALLLGDLPFSEVGDWLTGAAAPSESDWQLTIPQWQTFGDIEVPRLLTLSNKQLQAKIAVYSWRPE